jgi:predicted acylesterase/phospholipase RssA
MIKNLVISGGGIKIISILGSLKYLEEKSLIKTIKNFYGTSAGSLLCLLIILGYSSDELVNFIENFDLNKLFIINTDNFFEDFYSCENNKLEKLVKLLINYKLNKKNYENKSILSVCLNKQSLINDQPDGPEYNKILKINYENITMNDLFLITKKSLTITSVSIKKKKPIYIDHEIYPNLPVWKAILMSCCIPFIFKPIKWDNDLFIDGAVVDNFPLSKISYDDIKFTLGINCNIEDGDEKIEELNIYKYLLIIIKLMIKDAKISSFNIITININNNLISNPLDINITKDIKNKIINEGYLQTKEQYYSLFNKIDTKRRANSI